MIRLAWHWLGRWHEPLSVGASIALVGLVYLMPVSGGTAFAPLAGQPQASSLAHETPQRSPADVQYYRDQWRRESTQFYTLHPPRRDERPAARGVAPAVTTAEASLAPSQPSGRAVTQATHLSTATLPPRPPVAAVTDQPTALPPAAAAPGPPKWIERWRIAAALAAGLLAGLAFVSVWPASPIASEPALSQWQDNADASSRRVPADTGGDAAPLAAATAAGELIAIRLPAAWVGVRPTTSETARRAILAASYLIASLCGWSLLG